MNEAVKFEVNKASEAQIAEHLSCCDADFVPPLSDRVEMAAYARKIAGKATRFEAWSGDKLVGLVAAYCDDQGSRIAYITSVSVLREWMGKGIAASLMLQCIEHAKMLEMRQISLEVAGNNAPAIKLYEKSGFIAGNANAPFVAMELYLKSAGKK